MPAVINLCSRHIIFIITFITFTKPCPGQNDSYSVVSVQSPITYPLNAAIFGDSKTSVRVALSENTVAWYYMVSVTKGGSSNTTLLSQLSKLIGTKGLATTLISELIVPKGDAKCNVYVVDQVNSDLFLNNKQFNFFREGSAMSISQAKMDIRTSIDNLYYLAIDNPEFSSIKVSLEVVAVVNPNASKYGSLPGNRLDWQGQNGSNVVNIIKTKIEPRIAADLNKLIWTSGSINQLRECVVDKIISENKLLDFLNKGNILIDYEVMTNYNGCAPDYYYYQTEQEKTATLYGNIGWKSYEKGEIDRGIEYSQKSLQITPLFFAKANLSLCYLVKGLETEAIQNYIESIDILKNNRNTKPQKKWILNASIKDIQNATQRGSLKGAEDAVAILKTALSEYE